MPLYALEDLDDAIDATRAFLTPVDRSRWIKLALVALFIGGPGAGSTFQFSFGGNGTGGDVPVDLPEIALTPWVWFLVGAVVLVAVTLALVFLLIGSVMEFVFVESLRSERVTVRRYWRDYWRQGVRLFGFRLVLGGIVLGSVALLAAPLILAVLGGGPVGAVPWLVFLGFLPVFVVLAIVLGLVNGFTTAFVVPIMLLEDEGVIAGWRRLWPTITAHWQQYLAYAVAGFFLGILGAILVGIVTALLAIVLLIPFGILGAIGAAFLFLAEPVGWALIAVVALLFVLTVIAVAAIVQVPVQVYLRYYALLVLGDIEPAFDLVPDRRRAIRESSDDAT